PSWQVGQSILVVKLHPAHGAVGFVPALGRQVEPVERAHQQLGAAMIGRVAVEDVAALVFYEYAQAEHIGGALDRRQAEVVKRTSGLAIICCERYAKIVALPQQSVLPRASRQVAERSLWWVSMRK